MRWPKYWSFNFSISPSNEHSGLIYFRMDWLDLFAVQGTLKSLLQHYSSKASILWHSFIYALIFIISFLLLALGFLISSFSSCFRCATATAKSLKLYPTLCDPIDGSPPGSPIPGILQALTLEWAAISFSNAWRWKVKMKLLSRVRLLATPQTAAYQAPPFMGFSRQEYWSEVPLPSPCFRCRVRLFIWLFSCFLR